MYQLPLDVLKWMFSNQGCDTNDPVLSRAIVTGTVLSFITNNCYSFFGTCTARRLLACLSDVLQNLMIPFASRMQDIILPNILLWWDYSMEHAIRGFTVYSSSRIQLVLTILYAVKQNSSKIVFFSVDMTLLPRWADCPPIQHWWKNLNID